MLRMAKRNQKPKNTAKIPEDHEVVVWTFRPDHALLAQQLDACAKSTKRSRNALMNLLLEEGLKRLGFWPPPAPETAEDRP